MNDISGSLLLAGAALQIVAVGYGLYLLRRSRGARGAWLFLLGAMGSMLVWRLVMVLEVQPPAWFNALIAIWGAVCMLAAMALFGREVAARTRVEAERDALLDSERNARIDAERAGRAKDEFLATVSHELRTPLAAVLGWCAVARAPRTPPEDVTRALEVIERNARLQTRLVDDLLDVTRMYAGSLPLEFTGVRLAEPVIAAVQAARVDAAAKGVRVDVDADPEVVVRGDPVRLQQVVGNLVGNAIKFTPPGGSIVVRLTADGTRAKLEVVDDGEGISPEFLPHVFARFRQADGTVARRHGGLGLGLWIVEHLVRAHGGKISAASGGRGHGATFTVILPQASPTAPEVSSAAPVALGELTLAGLRVLVVDDEADVRQATTRALERFGAQVHQLESGRAIEIALQQYRPDVLLLDIGMPGEDGYSLMRRVRALPPGAGGSTPAISLTAHARAEDRMRALAAGFDAHLPKPIDLPALAIAIRSALAQQTSRGSAAAN